MGTRFVCFKSPVREKPLLASGFFLPLRDKEFMSDCALQINRQASPLVRTVGAEQTPVVTIDRFAMDSDAVVEHAYRTADFGDDSTSAYPGVRADLTQSHVILVVKALLPLMRKTYSIPENLSVKPVNAVYSLVTTPESKLRLLQRLPHFDSVKQFYFAITHFLGRGRFGGTGLYRHRPTGYETVTEDRLKNYIAAGDAFLGEHGDPRAAVFRRRRQSLRTHTPHSLQDKSAGHLPGLRASFRFDRSGKGYRRRPPDGSAHSEYLYRISAASRCAPVSAAAGTRIVQVHCHGSSHQKNRDCRRRRCGMADGGCHRGRAPHSARPTGFAS